MNNADRLDKIIAETEEIRDYLLEESVMMAPPGLKLEFGVASGTTINRIASVAKNDAIYGFDTFTGLPEEWNGMAAGSFSQNGDLPVVRDNVVLIKGMFQDTLDKFLEEHTDPVGFCHIDSDIYSACAFVLDRLKDRFYNGSIVVFDELAYYIGYEDNEYKAFLEFLEYSGFDFEFLGRRNREAFAFRLIKP